MGIPLNPNVEGSFVGEHKNTRITKEKAHSFSKFYTIYGHMWCFCVMVFLCIPFSMGFNKNYTVIFCNLACISIFIIGQMILQTSAV